METISSQREEREQEEWKRRDKRCGLAQSGEAKRDGRRFSNSRVRRASARAKRTFWLLVKRAHTWPRNVRPQKTRGTAIVLSAAAAKSTRGSLHDLPCLRLADSYTAPAYLVDSTFLSRVIPGRFRRVTLLLRPRDDFSRFLFQNDDCRRRKIKRKKFEKEKIFVRISFAMLNTLLLPLGVIVQMQHRTYFR